MKAPEKLYLPKRNKLPLEVVRDGKLYETDPQCMYGSVEYTRTDAFIDKATEWINNFYNEDTHSYLINEDIEKFINYMKGE